MASKQTRAATKAKAPTIPVPTRTTRRTAKIAVDPVPEPAPKKTSRKPTVSKDDTAENLEPQSKGKPKAGGRKPKQPVDTVEREAIMVGDLPIIMEWH